MVSVAVATAAKDRSRVPRTYYPLQLDFSYLACRRGRVIERGTGQTLEISRQGIRVKPLEILTPGVTDIKLQIAWPAALDDGTRLKLVVLGRPSWNGSRLVEVIILKHEFRTAPKGTALTGSSAADQSATLAAAAGSKRI